jgi:hypothetical protein
MCNYRGNTAEWRSISPLYYWESLLHNHIFYYGENSAEGPEFYESWGYIELY